MVDRSAGSLAFRLSADPSPRPRIVLADDHPIVLAGIEGLLAASAAFEIVAVCSNGGEALERIRELRPDIAVLDLSMPHLTGIQVLEALMSDQSATRIIILTASPADDEIARAIAAGATGFMLKQAAADELVACLHCVAGGGVWLPPSLIEPALQRNTERETASATMGASLTFRERELAILVAKGLSNKEIARKVGITEGTVKIHLHNVFQKLKVNNRAALALTAMRHLVVA